MGCSLQLLFSWKIRKYIHDDYPWLSSNIDSRGFSSMFFVVNSTGPTRSPATAWGKERWDLMTTGCWFWESVEKFVEEHVVLVKKNTIHHFVWRITHELSVVCFGTSNLSNHIPLIFGSFNKFQRRLFIECRLSFVTCFLTSMLAPPRPLRPVSCSQRLAACSSVGAGVVFEKGTTFEWNLKDNEGCCCTSWWVVYQFISWFTGFYTFLAGG